MANMSNDFIRVSRGYVNVTTQYGFEYPVYCELWGSAICSSYTLKVKIAAPKGYTVAGVDSDRDHDVTPSWIVFHNAVGRSSWSLDHNVQRIGHSITMHVERVVNGPLGIVVTNSRLGVVHASCGRIVSYADCLDEFNFAMEVAEPGDLVCVTLATESEAEEALACIDGDEHWIFYDSAILKQGVK